MSRVLILWPDTASDPYEHHFGPQTALLTESKREFVNKKAWKTSREKYAKLGTVREYTLEGETSAQSQEESKTFVRIPCRRESEDSDVWSRVFWTGSRPRSRTVKQGYRKA